MSDLKLIHHGLESEVEKPWVVDVINIVFVTKDGKQGLVVKTKNQVLEAKDKELTFVKTINGGHCFTLNWMVS